MDVHYGDMGQIEGIGFLRELELVQLLADHRGDLAVHDGHGVSRQPVHQPIGGLMLAELGARQCAVVDLAAVCRRSGRCAACTQGQSQRNSGCQGKPGWVLHEMRL
ncbi:hypothetical protein SDC9_166002 [bioreactor metagenome]|uniref:Uncharacterized protein n=1 Tax=bioreactor metagenome TaxID=1076179 RepID=A0A645FVU1_9ZZZZ